MGGSSKIILLSGVPATGKSTFGRWLAEKRQFVHWDLENQPVLQVEKRELEWMSMLSSRQGIHEFVDALAVSDKRIALDWGFPPQHLGVVSALRDEGVEIWWFDGDRPAAREAFLRRGTVDVKYLDIQLEKIDRYWPEIRRVFGRHVVTVLDAKGRHLESTRIARLVLGKR